jgi:hypothetical protein
MAAYKRHNFRFLAFGESGQNLVNGEVAKTNDSPSKFLNRRIGYDRLCIAILQQCPANTGPDDTLAHLRDESAACDLFFGENSQDYSSLISDFAPFESPLTASSSIPDTPALAWDQSEWSKCHSTCTSLRQISFLSTRRVYGSHRLGPAPPLRAGAE